MNERWKKGSSAFFAFHEKIHVSADGENTDRIAAGRKAASVSISDFGFALSVDSHKARFDSETAGSYPKLGIE